MSAYYLGKEAFVCESGGHAVFLDLMRDRYVALPPEDVRVLKKIFPSLVGQRPAFDGTAEYGYAAGQKATSLVTSLEQEGLLVRDSSRGKIARLTAVDVPLDSYWKEEGSWPHLRVEHLANFFQARLSAAALLKVLPLRRTVRRVRVRKQQQQIEGDAHDLRAMVATFLILQSLLPFGPGSCLGHSLAMLEFLAAYELYPMWVFGVRVQPFKAHCWIQSGSIVLNDSESHVSAYTPIMAI